MVKDIVRRDGWRSVHSESKEKDLMEIPVWLKPVAWGAIGGASAMSIGGFSQLGWMTKTTADQMAREQTDAAVVTALVPFCVAKAKQDPDKAAFGKIQAEQSSYSRSDLVMKAGWATVGGMTAPGNALAHACSDSLHDMTAG